MAESVRRSTRRGIKKAGYAIGDVIELQRLGTDVHAKLLVKVADEPSMPRWLVTYDNDGVAIEEEVLEKSFGPVTGHTEEPPPSPESSFGTTASGGSKSRPTNSKKKSSKNGKLSAPFDSKSGSSSDEAASKQKNKKKKEYTPKEHNTGAENESSPTLATPQVEAEDSSLSAERNTNGDVEESSVAKHSKASDREQRSRRRQAGLEEESLVSVVAIPSSVAGHKHPAPNGEIHSASISNGKAKKAKVMANDPNVIKVPMLTGTLYLYRGVRRRVEFVRKC